MLSSRLPFDPNSSFTFSQSYFCPVSGSTSDVILELTVVGVVGVVFVVVEPLSASTSLIPFLIAAALEALFDNNFLNPAGSVCL